MRHQFKRNYFHQVFGIYVAGLGVILPSYAAVSVNDTLTGASSTYNWQALGGACLTAGDNTGSIPACSKLPYYNGKILVGGTTGRLPDTEGNGALRLTNGAPDTGTNGNNQTGAVYSKENFPSNAGVDITFKTITYGGNGYGNHASVRSGADGIAFFLSDADQVGVVDASTKTGSYGGALGYSCSHAKTDNDGLYGAYIGLGIDEFGNFSNQSDNSGSGVGQGWNRVTLRGAGNINWKWLSTVKKDFYPSKFFTTTAAQQKAVGEACKNDKLYKYTSATAKSEVKKTGINYDGFYNYPYIVHSDIMDTKINNNDNDNARKKRKAIFSEQAKPNPLRGNATPITYNIKVTQDGLLSFAYSYNGGQAVNVLDKRDIKASNGPLPKNFRFGFAGGTGGGSNVHEIMCFKAEQISGSASSAAGNVPSQGRVMAGSQLYIASYHPQNWWGSLTAQNLVEDSQTGIVTINSTANWDASCKLTGGTCEATGKNVTAQTTRNLFTWNGGGKALTWANLNNDQQTALGDQKALEWMRGSRADERKSDGTGSLRTRDSVLGDIVNSSPTWVGAPNSPYQDAWKDMVHGGTMPEGASSYASFASTNKTRTNAVYVGANDGFLHAFRSGKSKADGTLDMTDNDGQELFAYMPDQVLRTANNSANENLALPSTTYGHNAFVDATPGTGDLYYDGAWHTWLVGGLGLGGNLGGVAADDTSVSKGAVYALDITDPANFSAGNVLGEWSSDTLSCTNHSTCKDGLGSTVGIPLVRRLHDGNWAVIFPNGQNSKTGEAGIYVMTVAQSNGARTFSYIKAADPQTSGGTITKRNGISQVTAADLDGDHITDYVYGGDMMGNVWRFDLTSKNPLDWHAGTYPVFKANHPITTAIAVSSTTKNEIYRVILNFGTGRLYPETLSKGASSVAGDHYLYGIWDADMAAWNGKSSFKYQSLALSGTAITIAGSELLTRSITEVAYDNPLLGVNGVRTVSTEKLCWKGSTTCSTVADNNKRGWHMKLPGKNEQVVYNPVLQDGFFVINTTVPEVSELLSCDTQAAAGFTMAIPPDTGVSEKSYFKNNEWTGGVIAGYGTSGVGSMMTGRSSSRAWGITQTHSGKPKTLELDPSANANYKRITWIKRR